MTDVAWGKDVEQPPPKKRLVPTWVWVVGSGCLLMLVIGGGACIYLFTQAKKWLDPDVQWAQVAEVMPMDGRPQGWTILGLPDALLPGDIRMWTLSAPQRKEQVVLMHYGGTDAAEQRRQFLDTRTDAANLPMLGQVGRVDPQAGVIEVQGRSLQCVRYFTSKPRDAHVKVEKDKEGIAEVFQNAFEGSNVIVDVTPEGGAGFDVIIFSMQGSSQPVPDEVVVKFLEPFRIGPEHGEARTGETAPEKGR